MAIPQKFAITGMLALCLLGVVQGQDLAPRAYIITPVHSNAVTLGYAYYTGNLLIDGATPITGATGTIDISTISYYHSLSFFGRSSNILVTLPYSIANLRGEVFGAETRLYRSGLMDSVYRLSVNLKGAPAMPLQEMQKWRQKMLLGVSLKIVAPTGQYDPTKLINLGNNRWAFKPEFGYSQRWGKWVLDAYAAAWFYTTNSEFFSRNQYFSGTRTQNESPIAALEWHLSYDFKPRMWISLDGNFWSGGKTSLNGVENPNTLQRNSRVGVTGSVPITKHQSMKVNYDRGAYIHYGGNFQSLSVAWQYSWIGRPN
jgi:Putative MetA-pathway of phenol degradation